LGVASLEMLKLRGYPSSTFTTALPADSPHYVTMFRGIHHHTAAVHHCSRTFSSLPSTNPPSLKTSSLFHHPHNSNVLLLFDSFIPLLLRQHLPSRTHPSTYLCWLLSYLLSSTSCHYGQVEPPVVQGQECLHWTRARSRG